MKKLLIVSLMLVSLLSLAACGSTQTTDTADDSQTTTDTTTDTTTNDTKDTASDGKIAPLPSGVDVNNLTDAEVAASFDANSLKETDGKLELSFTVYDYELFDAADITGLKEGDVLTVSGKDVTVTSVEEDNGYVTVNGGEEQGGMTFAPSESGGTYYVIGMDDAKSYNELGQLTLPVADTCVLTDDADLDNPGQTTEASGLLELFSKEDSDPYGYNPQNTTVTVANSQITAIHRSYQP